MYQLKFYVMKTLLSDEIACLDEEKYQKIIPVITEHLNDLCVYLFKTIQYDCSINKLILNDENILALLTPEYVLNRAYEYSLFLENQHEYAHECEELAR